MCHQIYFIGKVTQMTKRLFFLLGVITGILFAVITSRKRMEHLKALEAEKAEANARYDEYARERQVTIAAMPFERRMDWELFEASLKSHNYQPDWSDNDEESH
jgi:hypothetical protein